MFAEALRLCLCCVSIISCTTALALPPLGLTQTDYTPSSLEIIDGTAYISGNRGILPVATSGPQNLIEFLDPTGLGIRLTTNVVKAADGKLYAAATFGPFSDRVSQLFSLSEPMAAVATWDGLEIRSLDNQRNAYGRRVFCNCGDTRPSILGPDGSITPIEIKPNYEFGLGATTPSGYAFGTLLRYGQNTELVVWSQNQGISYLNYDSGTPLPVSIRDSKGGGLNYGFTTEGIKFDPFGYQYFPHIQYADGRRYTILDQYGNQFTTTSIGAEVSQSDFSIIKSYYGLNQSYTFYAYFPGIVPGFNDRAIPLSEAFPELASFSEVYFYDLVSVNVYLYMTIKADGANYLFGTRDPSVVVPEPAGVVMLLLLCSSLGLVRSSHS